MDYWDVLGDEWITIRGCKKVSKGCKYCYAERMHGEFHAKGFRDYQKPFTTTVFFKDNLKQPINARDDHVYFVNSMADTFQDDVPTDFIKEIFNVMHQAKQHTYQVLTKHPERMLQLQQENEITFAPHIWAGTSVEDKKVLHRIDTLRQINTDIHFIVFEPLLENLGDMDLTNIQWCIVGGETEPNGNARPMKKEWAIDILAHCEYYKIPFAFKHFSGLKQKREKLLGQIWDEHPLFEYEKKQAIFNQFFQSV